MGSRCHDQRLSVTAFNMGVKMVVEPEHSRPMTKSELMQLCHVLLSMVDPKSCDRCTPSAKRISNESKKSVSSDIL
eukprot:2271965-Amphidinium_carterae.1